MIYDFHFGPSWYLPGPQIIFISAPWCCFVVLLPSNFRPDFILAMCYNFSYCDDALKVRFSNATNFHVFSVRTLRQDQHLRTQFFMAHTYTHTNAIKGRKHVYCVCFVVFFIGFARLSFGKKRNPRWCEWKFTHVFGKMPGDMFFFVCDVLWVDFHSVQVPGSTGGEVIFLKWQMSAYAWEWFLSRNDRKW